MPAATVAILARLWGAFAREPVPAVVCRRVGAGILRVTLADGTVLAGDEATSRPFAQPSDDFAVAVTRPGDTTAQRITEPGALVRATARPLGPHAARLAAELDNSVANLALARQVQPEPDSGAAMLARAAGQPDPLAWLEQSVVDGHPLHPCARTRIGLSTEEVLAYAPEHRPVVMLRRVIVPEKRWYGVDSGPVLFLHPFQHERLREEQPWLSRVDGEVAARPLMSLRTLALVATPSHHVKTAVDIQMTSAVRTLSPASVHNGYHLSALLGGLTTRMPAPVPLADLRGGAAIVDGEPDRRLGVLHRGLPGLRPGEQALPLAALAAPSAADGAPLVTELVGAGYRNDPLALVAGLARLVLPAVLHPLDAGVALEAHGQNLLGVVRDNRLVRLLYRDFGGVRVSPRRLRDHGIEPPRLLGDIRSDDPEVLRTKVFASAVSTVLAEVVAVLARTMGLDEEKAWHSVARVVRAVPAPDAAHLFAGTLPAKAMTAMRLAADPVDDIWCQVPNPMAGLG